MSKCWLAGNTFSAIIILYRKLGWPTSYGGNMRKEIEDLKEKLNKLIEIYGRDSPEVLKISEILDEYIVEDMKKCKYINKKTRNFNDFGL